MKRGRRLWGEGGWGGRGEGGGGGWRRRKPDWGSVCKKNAFHPAGQLWQEIKTFPSIYVFTKKKKNSSKRLTFLGSASGADKYVVILNVMTPPSLLHVFCFFPPPARRKKHPPAVPEDSPDMEAGRNFHLIRAPCFTEEKNKNGRLFVNIQQCPTQILLHTYTLPPPPPVQHITKKTTTGNRFS